MIAIKPLCTFALVGVMTATVSTGQLPRPADPPRQGPAAAGATATARQGSITGQITDVNGAPAQNATVQIRNLSSQKIEQVVKPDSLGRFSFTARPDIPYLVEIVSNDGQIIAVGDIITIQAGEVAAVSLAVPTKLPAAAGLFTDTIGSVVSAITSAGVTVLPDAPPLSPER